MKMMLYPIYCNTTGKITTLQLQTLFNSLLFNAYTICAECKHSIERQLLLEKSNNGLHYLFLIKLDTQNKQEHL
jgi:hypothetical protein